MNLVDYYLNTVHIKDPRSVVLMDTSQAMYTPKKYTDIMVDLETLDVIASASILSIGAVAFNLNEQETVRDYLYGADCTARSFEIVVDLKNQVEWDRRTIGADTFRWWLGQDAAAKAVLTKKGEALWYALEAFQQWANQVGVNINETRLWGNGAAFDNAILRDAYGKCGIEHPIRFRNDMCYRTLKTMFMPGKVEVEDQNLLTAHNARHDAIFQAVILQKLWAKIKPGRITQEMIGS